jgi:hypothetical protein
VCATCHDAPPTYVHVKEWERSRMARSDEPPATRAAFGCARCHMTAGFLAAVGAHGMRFADEDDLHAEPAGIGCAACHASHRAHQGKELVRAVPLPAPFDAPADEGRFGSSAVCVPCHAPIDGERYPSASAAALYAGRVPLAGAPTVRAPHDNVPGGCIGCHGATARPKVLDHSFAVDRARCAGCHGGSSPPEERAGDQGVLVHERAVFLLTKLRERLGLAASSAPAHAVSLGGPPQTPGVAPPAQTPEALARALYEVGLVVEDPAAGVHNAPLARALLLDAESALRAAGP